MLKDFNFKLAEERLSYAFKNKELLITAFTHSSFANENNANSNERLEFLGDSVLGLIVTQNIYSLTEYNEGELSKMRSLLVSEEPLSQIVDKLKIEELLKKGKGESKNKVESKAIKCDLFEAVVGAIYLDGGMQAAKKFIEKHLHGLFKQVLKLQSFEDSKTKLQEKFPKAKIVYSTNKIGQSNNPQYKSVVFINDIACGKGEAGNKRTAEQLASAEALKKVTKV